VKSHEPERQSVWSRHGAVDQSAAEGQNLMAATRRMTGAAGLAVAVLFAAGNGLWATEQPQAGASGRQIVAFYTHTSGRVIAGASMSLIAGALFVLFAAGLRAILDDVADDGVPGMTAFGGALLAVAAGLGAETINMAGALRAEHGQLSAALGRSLFEISYVLGYNAAGVGVGILIFGVAFAALRAQALVPRWLALVLILVALAFLTPLSRFLLAPSLLLLLIASAQLLRGSAKAGRLAV
jgi:hypothetical protein